jgi:hypothetical protein
VPSTLKSDDNEEFCAVKGIPCTVDAVPESEVVRELKYVREAFVAAKFADVVAPMPTELTRNPLF